LDESQKATVLASVGRVMKLEPLMAAAAQLFPFRETSGYTLISEHHEYQEHQDLNSYALYGKGYGKKAKAKQVAKAKEYMEARATDLEKEEEGDQMKDLYVSDVGNLVIGQENVLVLWRRRRTLLHATSVGKQVTRLVPVLCLLLGKRMKMQLWLSHYYLIMEHKQTLAN
jgi:hypothetical protein